MRVLVVALILASCILAAQASVPKCRNGANVLVYGRLTNHGSIDNSNAWANWLKTALPTSNITIDNSAATVTATSWFDYDLVITALLSGRPIMTANESANVANYVNSGGALITLAGFSNDQNDINRQQAPLAAFGIGFGPVSAITTFAIGGMVYNPANPLVTGLAGKWISYAGGWPSTPYANGVLFAQEGNPATDSWNPSKLSVGQTIVLPSGGKIVAWGDEWATFLSEFSAPNNGNEIFWKNAVSWVSGICTAPPTDVCGTAYKVGSTCTSATHTSTSKGFTLSFSTSNTNCN